MAEWQPIDTFVMPEPADASGVHGTNSARVFLYFPDMTPSEIIGYCRATAAYGGVYWEWCDDEGDQIELPGGRIEPSHWMPLPEPPK